MDIKEYIASPEISVLDAMQAINSNARGVIYICDDNRLLGVVTDGNIRRHILSNGALDINISEIMNTTPKVIKQSDDVDCYRYMEENNITSVPIVNSKGNVITIKFLNAETAYRSSDLHIPVVIMAGGKGTRLSPYTDVLPKPLIPVGNETITELIISRFQKFGCNEFNMIVNYKRNLIKAFFSEADKSSNIKFTDEENFLGTAGGLKLIESDYKSTFFLTNCDILVEADYGDILEYHKINKNILTMVCAAKKVEIPYGTIELNSEGNIVKLEEKPSFSFMANTGFYVIEPEFIKYIPENTFVHITEIIEKCIDMGERIGMYPISENAWFDMGQMGELERMKRYLEKM
ncbi:sugar phosphate nucleotidyltransferase [Gallibacter sp. Marseille-QA0791]|uniref:sugar phosphate nucleotidyltransferase n=1 Tax=Gallibacter sp. Marseille-QA0791 TaxID=3378781 RepID=UPI003D1480D9